MSLIGGYNTDPVFNGTIFGGFGGYFGMPLVSVDESRTAPAVETKVTPNDPLDRAIFNFTYAGRGIQSGFDKAPPISLDLIWKMRRFSIIVLAYAAVTDQIIAGTQSIEILSKTADPDLSAKMKAAAEEDFLPMVPTWLPPSLECLHFGNWMMETIWDRKNGRTAPVAFRSFLPGEVVLFQDRFGQFCGFESNGVYRDARYAYLAVNQPHIHRINGFSRNENCREEYWRIKQSELNADKTENKASDRQMIIKWPMGFSLTNSSGGQVFSKEFAQTAVNGAVRGDAMVVPRFYFDAATISAHPELAEVEPVKIENIDWGNIGPSIEAHLARITSLKTDCQRAWNRPERESTESQHGSKADSSNAADLGTTDSEMVAAARMAEFNAQVIDRWAITNFGPNTAGIVGMKQAPLADPQQAFLQSEAVAITQDTTTGPIFQANIDQRALADRVGIPLVSEEEAAKVIAKQEADKQAAQKQQVDAMKAKTAQQQPPAGKPAMKIAMSDDDQADLSAILQYVYPPLALADAEVGHWITLDGTHVYIKDGRVVDGPSALRGKNLTEAHEHVANEHDRQAAYHGKQAAAAKESGDHEKAAKHAENQKAHEARAASVRKAGAEHAAKAEEPEHLQGLHEDIQQAKEIADRTGKPLSEVVNKAHANAQLAAKYKQPADAPAHLKQIDEQNQKLAERATAIKAIVDKEQSSSYSAHADAFGSHMAQGDKAVAAGEDSRASAHYEAANAHAKARDAHQYYGKQGEKADARADNLSKSAHKASKVAQSQPKGTVADHAKAINGIVDDVKKGTVSTQRIERALRNAHDDLSKPQLDKLASKLEIAGANSSKADAIDKMRTVINNQWQQELKGGNIKSQNVPDNGPAFTPVPAPNRSSYAGKPGKSYDVDTGENTPKEPLADNLKPHAAAFNKVLDDLDKGPVSTDRIDSTIKSIGDNLDKDSLNKLAAHLDIAGKSASKSAALDKMRTALIQQAQMAAKTRSF